MKQVSTSVGRPVVLLVDNAEHVRYQLRLRFEARGWIVLEAVDEKEMDAVLRSQHVDAIVLDRHWDGEEEHAPFGGLKGDLLMQVIASRSPYLCVVVYTAYPEESVETRMTRHGAFQVINKSKGGASVVLACSLGVIWKRIQFLRDRSITWIAFDKTVSAIESEIMPLLLDPEFISLSGRMACEIVTLLPGGLGRLHRSGNKLSEVAVLEPIRELSRSIVVDPFGSEESRCIFDVSQYERCGSRLVAAIYERDISPSENSVTERLQSVRGFVLLESSAESAFSEYHIDVAMSLANLLSEALIREMVFVTTGTRERSDEREELLMSVAQGISDSLQLSQSFLDSAKRSLSTDHVSPNMLEFVLNNIDSACNGIEDSVLLVNRLSRDASDRVANLECIDIGAVIESTLSRAQAPEDPFKCDIVWARPSESLDVLIDVEEFSEGLLILLRQSIQAAEQAHIGQKDGGVVEIQLSQVGNGIVLRIADDGAAIPEDQLPWAFQRISTHSFPMPEEQRRPSGLWRLYHHIQQIGGKATALIDDMGRTMFELILPVAATSKHVSA